MGTGLVSGVTDCEMWKGGVQRFEKGLQTCEGVQVARKGFKNVCAVFGEEGEGVIKFEKQ